MPGFNRRLLISTFYVVGLWCLMLISTIFQYYRDSQFLLMEESGENHRSAASH
jgi:hypothetical protein